jgi:hypothetical protein
VQHHPLVVALAASPNTALRDELLGELVSGATRVGCVRLLECAGYPDAAGRLVAECDDVRGRLDGGLAGVAAMSSARADAADLALTPFGSLIVM